MVLEIEVAPNLRRALAGDQIDLAFLLEPT